MPLDSIYQVGELAPLEATFKNAAGVPTDTTVTLEIRRPDGTLASPTPTHLGNGVYHYDQTLDQPGLWWYAFIGSGSVTATEQNSFYVQARYTASNAYPLSNVALLALDEARDYVLGNPADDRADAKLIPAINEMSAAVIAYTQREWLPLSTAVTRKFFYRGGGILSLRSCDLRTATSIVAYTDYPLTYQTTLSAGTTTVVSDYRLGPTGGMPPASTYRWIDFSNMWRQSVYTPYYYRGFEVAITGNWGIGVIPDDVKRAVKIAIKDSYENPEGGASRTIGPLSYTEPVEDLSPTSSWRALPAESRALLAPYRDDPVVVAA